MFIFSNIDLKIFEFICWVITSLLIRPEEDVLKIILNVVFLGLWYPCV